MYEHHWQLRRAPFSTAIRLESFFPAPSHQAALNKLRFLLEQQHEGAIVVAPPGCGKTHLAEIAWQLMEEQRGPVATVQYPLLSPAELVTDIAVKLGTETPGNLLDSSLGLDFVLRRLEARLCELTAQHRPALISIDDAHLIEDPRVFECLRLLLNLHRPGKSEFSLVLWGRPELISMLRRVHRLDERLSFACVLLPLTESLTAEYVRHRLDAAGSQARIFTDEALQAVFELSGGVPRQINRLCEMALLVGFAERRLVLDREQIEAVATELPGRMESAARAA